MESAVLTTPELGRQMLARKLLASHAARCGYAGQANFAHWGFHLRWLETPAPRPDFWTFVINELGSKR